MTFSHPIPSRLVALTALVVATCFAHPANAQPASTDEAAAEEEPDEATLLKQRGDEALRTLRYAEALELYDRAYALSKSPALLYNQGRALQALRRFPDALEKLEAFRRDAPEELRARVPQLDELIAEVRGKVAVVTVTSNVKGAVVTLDQTRLGKAPIRELRVNAGGATIEVTAEGYRPFRKQVKLSGNLKTTRIAAKLEKRDKSGVLVVRSVKGARVVIDGKVAGNAPAEMRLQPGTHEVRVSRDGFEPETRSAVLKPTERKVITVRLEETPGITERWWFWAGVGTVVVGGAVLTYALLTERSPDEGDIPPGKVAAPLFSF